MCALCRLQGHRGHRAGPTRKLSDTATSTAQKYDKSVCRKLGGLQNQVKNINNSTSSDEAANLAGRTSTVLVCETNVTTPQKQGYHGQDPGEEEGFCRGTF